MRVYYYYQFVYKLVYYNNKIDNLFSAASPPCTPYCEQRSAKKRQAMLAEQVLPSCVRVARSMTKPLPASCTPSVVCKTGQHG